MDRISVFITELRPYQCAILIRDVGSDHTLYEHNGSEKLVSASMIKLPVLLAVLEEVRQGQAGLQEKITIDPSQILTDSLVYRKSPAQDSVEKLLTWMIINSDNTASNVLTDYFGMAKVNEYIKMMGLKDTVMQRRMLDHEAIAAGFNNYTSHEDLYVLYKKLWNREILNDELCVLALDILLRQRDRNLFLRYLDGDVRYYHKTGQLDHICHDGGILVLGDKVLYTGISIYGFTHEGQMNEAMGHLGRLIYEFLGSQ